MGLRVSKPQPEGKPRSWYRDNFFLTTDKRYLEPHVVNDIFRSDLMWWNDPLEPGQMKKMLDNCLTLCLYWVPETEEQMRSAFIPASFGILGILPLSKPVSSQRANIWNDS
jgi:hypothetical protein